MINHFKTRIIFIAGRLTRGEKGNISSLNPDLYPHMKWDLIDQSEASKLKDGEIVNFEWLQQEYKKQKKLFSQKMGCYIIILY